MSLLYCAPQPPKCSQWFCYGPHYLGGQNDRHLTTIRTGGSTKCRHNGRQSARIDTIPVGRGSLICAHKEGAAGPSSAEIWPAGQVLRSRRSGDIVSRPGLDRVEEIAIMFWFCTPHSLLPYRSNNFVNNDNIDSGKNDKIDKNVEHIANVLITSTFDTVDFWACQLHFGQQSNWKVLNSSDSIYIEKEDVLYRWWYDYVMLLIFC